MANPITNPATQISISSVLKRTGKTIETVLSAADLLDDGMTIATNYMARIKSEQIKESKLKELEFDNNLKLAESQLEMNFKANAYQIGAKARQLENLPEYEENISAFKKLLK